ncbi:MAG: hypothetical protein ABFD64_00935 [Armatimonadota bacterium]
MSDEHVLPDYLRDGLDIVFVVPSTSGRVTAVAKRYGVSDVAIHKSCKRSGACSIRAIRVSK